MAKTQRSYEELQAEIARLSKEAQELRSREQQDVVARIKVAIKTYGLTASDLGFTGANRGSSSKPKTSTQVKAKTVKFKDSAGNTWGGRGKRPEWIKKALAAGKQLQDFSV
jgi:DNA-binding protein H-NS